MRPTPDHRDSYEETGRIISLGDVRRRRGVRRRAPDRQYLAALLLIALFAWACWLTVVFTVPPVRLLTYIAFFAPLWCGLAATGALVAYGIGSRRGVLPGLRVSVRRGILMASVIVLNLALVAAHKWLILVTVVSVGLAGLYEYLATRRAAWF